MGRVLYFLGFFVAATILGASTAVSAETITRSNRITVNAVVLPAHSVIVDDYNQVIKIYSNTAGPAVPTFYRLTISGSTKLAENSALLGQYQQAIADAPGRVGVLYERPIALGLLPTENSQRTLPAAISSIPAAIALAR